MSLNETMTFIGYLASFATIMAITSLTVGAIYTRIDRRREWKENVETRLTNLENKVQP